MSQLFKVNHLDKPALDVVDDQCILKGDWLVAAVSQRKEVQAIEQRLEQVARKVTSWDLNAVRLDHIWAGILWNAWGRKLPENIKTNSEQQVLFERIEKYAPLPQDVQQNKSQERVVTEVGLISLSFIEHINFFIQLVGQFILDFSQTLKTPLRAPWKDFSSQLLRMGAQALPITGLVGFLIGVVIVYLLSSYLRSYGLELYIIDMTGVVAVRELGGLLAAILVAGRSGSTITAQIGVMRLREELDAMHVLGISPHFRLVFPRVMALSLIMPFVSLWTSLVAIFGGMIAANFTIGLTNDYFLEVLPTTVYIGNVWMNLGKGVVFGF
ncbi:MAG: MlaE family ABC transporter permease, partial [Saezia sp.]